MLLMLKKLIEYMKEKMYWPFFSEMVSSNCRRQQAFKNVLLYNMLCFFTVFLLSFFCSWGWTYYTFKEYLNTYSNQLYLNGIRAFNVMRELGTHPEEFEVCSKSHLQYINQQLYKSSHVMSISYVVDGNIVCNNKGIKNYGIPTDPSITMDNGVRIWGYWPSATLYGLNHLVAGRGAYIVEFNPLSILSSLDINQKLKPLLSIRHGEYYVGFTEPLPYADLAFYYEKNIFSGQYLVEMGISNAQFKSAWKRYWIYFLPANLAIILIGFIYIFFRVQSQYSLDHLISRGLPDDEFHVLYQPIVELKTERIIGAEALIRWDFDGQLINTDYFISQAELMGKISDITRFVLTKSAKDMVVLRENFQDFSVSINVAPQDLQDDWLLVFLQELEVQYGLRPAEVKLELTERGITKDKEMLAQLNALRCAGYRLAIDDFGTGYSSLSYLHALPLDLLKIDRSFVATLCSDAIGRSVTPNIIAMAHKLDLTIIAEGIETKEQHKALLDLGVQWGQGWLFGKAEPINDFLGAYLLRNRPK
ncbi:sensor c-di-GMP phosphodiesterase-like protein [Iodobacter fluviatilis]|uniref:Sensor c-di-GMP phosphodiesterase-like protein n=2 Tax=Iodobacter fluviatilis TaxID=537 RepID=A0A377Q4K1_9NEIS|nr:sensor c-di-GMP phosphodiesterase-like protein [Iodobacter fluviatilis]STQ90154.1 Uncharacterized membrane protein YjcC [Iodobacter fluviatilis]